MVWYDVGCRDGPFSDNELAITYMSELSGSCDSDCIEDGTKWSIAYDLNGSVFLLFTLNSILGGFGAYSYYPRAINTACNFVLSIIAFSALITTAIFRWRTQGKLCALSLQPSQINDSGNFITSSSFERDGNRLTGLWVFQLIFLGLYCVLGAFPCYSA